MYKKIIRDGYNERFVNICNHCGNNTSQQVASKHTGTDVLYGEDGQEFPVDADYKLAECSTCKNITLYFKAEYMVDDLFGEILYPSQRNLSSYIPEKVRKTYHEAKIIAKLAPNAFATQIRRALEFLCLDKKIEGRSNKKNVQRRINTTCTCRND